MQLGLAALILLGSAAKKKQQPANWQAKQCLGWLVAHPALDEEQEEPASPPSTASEAEGSGSAQVGQGKGKAKHKQGKEERKPPPGT
eukprot:g5086.t1